MIRHEKVLSRLVEGLLDIFGNEIESIVLYGSVARGTDTAESDADVAVLLHSFNEEMHDRMTDLVVDLELEHDLVLSVLLIDYNSYLEWKDVMPFYRNVNAEGVTLWQAA